MNKTSLRTRVTKTIATFGTAMSTLYCTADLNADIVDLTFNGGNPSVSNPFFPGSATTPTIFNIDQVPNVGGSLGHFVAFNDSFDGTGRTHAITGASVLGNLMSHRVLEFIGGSLFINPSTFVGDSDGIIGGDDENSFDGSGTAFVGFRTAAGNVGWYQMSFTIAGPVNYNAGQLGTNGETLFIAACGGCGCPFDPGDVNGDGTIDLLDVAPFIDLLVTNGFDCSADINADGTVDLLDVAPFVDLIAGG